jgi:hypothetical protein
VVAVRLLPESRRDLVAAQTRQSDVEQDEIRPAQFGRFDGLQPVLSGRYFVPEELEVRPIPKPPSERASERSPCVNSSNIAGNLSDGMPTPRSLTLMTISSTRALRKADARRIGMTERERRVCEIL